MTDIFLHVYVHVVRPANSHTLGMRQMHLNNFSGSHNIKHLNLIQISSFSHFTNATPKHLILSSHSHTMYMLSYGDLDFKRGRERELDLYYLFKLQSEFESIKKFNSWNLLISMSVA